MEHLQVVDELDLARFSGKRFMWLTGACFNDR